MTTPTQAMQCNACKPTGSGSGSSGPDMLSIAARPVGASVPSWQGTNTSARARIHPRLSPSSPLVSSLPCHPCKSSRCAWPHTAQRPGHNGSVALPVGASPQQHSAGNGRTRCQPVTPARTRPSRRRPVACTALWRVATFDCSLGRCVWAGLVCKKKNQKTTVVDGSIFVLIWGGFTSRKVGEKLL
jgi:hypothetical protein